jgi:hypothetical protein
VVTGVGSVAGGIIVALIIANDLSESETGHGLAGNAMKAVGDKKDANTADLIFTATLAVASAVVSGGSDASSLKTLGEVVHGASQAGVGVTNRAAATHVAASEEAHADAEVAQAEVTNVDAQFGKVVDRMKKIWTAQEQMITDAQETMQQRGRRHVA